MSRDNCYNERQTSSAYVCSPYADQLLPLHGFWLNLISAGTAFTRRRFVISELPLPPESESVYLLLSFRANFSLLASKLSLFFEWQRPMAVDYFLHFIAFGKFLLNSTERLTPIDRLYGQFRQIEFNEDPFSYALSIDFCQKLI